MFAFPRRVLRNGAHSFDWEHTNLLPVSVKDLLIHQHGKLHLQSMQVAPLSQAAVMHGS